MFLSIQIQLTGPLPNLLDQMCQEVRKVHQVWENINPEINLDFEENSPFQEGVISETFQDQTRPKRTKQSYKHG